MFQLNNSEVLNHFQIEKVWLTADKEKQSIDYLFFLSQEKWHQVYADEGAVFIILVDSQENIETYIESLGQTVHSTINMFQHQQSHVFVDVQNRFVHIDDNALFLKFYVNQDDAFYFVEMDFKNKPVKHRG